MTDTAAPAPEAFSSVHTTSFPALLRELRCSLLVTTFQAGRVIVMRPQQDSINTHFFALPRPMGLAADANRLFVGAHRSVHEYRNVPAVAPRVDPPNAHDAVYLLRVQTERGGASVFPSLPEYTTRFGMTRERRARLKPGAVVMHPGPMNRGVEIAAEVADDADALVLEQVRLGVAVRMAVLFRLLGGETDA